jgi:plastocyanin
MVGRVATLIAGAALGVAVLAGCSVSSSTGAVGFTAPPAGFDPSSPVISAKDIAFDTQDISAPLGVAFTLVFRNDEANVGIPHNVSIYRDAAFKDRIVEGRTIEGKGVIGYPVAALPIGTYYFQCDIHPIEAMRGELHVP